MYDMYIPRTHTYYLIMSSTWMIVKLIDLLFFLAHWQVFTRENAYMHVN